MSDSRFQHRLIHILLQEQVGAETPPDLTQRILSRALPDLTFRAQGERSGQRVIRLRWAIPAAAAAAAVAIAVAVWMAAPSGYPAPKASGDFRLVAADKVRRGATIRTEERSAVLELGGYCRVEVRPRTTLRIDGRARAEEVFLKTGTAVCRVDANFGRFTVRTELGTVRVKGTEFTVRVRKEAGRKSMWVKVGAGSVLVSDGRGGEVLSAGQERTIRDSAPAASGTDDEARLRKELRVLQQRTREIEILIRELREDNSRLRKELEEKRRASQKETITKTAETDSGNRK